MSEFERFYDVRQLPAEAIILSASPDECAALAVRFDLVAVKRFEAAVILSPEGLAVCADGRLSAVVVQRCAVSGEDLTAAIDEPVKLRFVPAADPPIGEEEIELQADDCDELEMDGTRFDLGEALAQGLALAIDPFASGPGANEARQRAGLIDEGASGPFAALAALRKPNGPAG